MCIVSGVIVNRDDAGLREDGLVFLDGVVDTGRFVIGWNDDSDLNGRLVSLSWLPSWTLKSIKTKSDQVIWFLRIRQTTFTLNLTYVNFMLASYT